MSLYPIVVFIPVTRRSLVESNPRYQENDEAQPESCALFYFWDVDLPEDYQVLKGLTFQLL
jgi:hypothetical protein